MKFIEVFLDFTNALDTTNRQILIKKTWINRYQKHHTWTYEEESLLLNLLQSIYPWKITRSLKMTITYVSLLITSLVLITVN